MGSKPRQLSEIHRENVASAVLLAQASIDSLQSIVAIQMNLANMLFQTNVDNAKAIASASDPQQAVVLRSQFTRKTMQTLIDAAREIAEIGNDSRLEFSHLLTEQLTSGSNEMLASFKTFFGALPGQNPLLVEAMQQALNQTSHALQQIAPEPPRQAAGKSARKARRT